MIINKVALTHVKILFSFFLLEPVHWWVECVVIFSLPRNCGFSDRTQAHMPQPGMIDGCYSLSSVCSHLTVTNKTQTLMDPLQMKQIVNFYLLPVCHFASLLCNLRSSAHHRTCTAVAAAWLISQWCLGSKTKHARDSRELLLPAVQMGPPVLITSYCYGYLHTEGLGPFQTFLIESMKQIK